MRGSEKDLAILPDSMPVALPVAAMIDPGCAIAWSHLPCLKLEDKMINAQYIMSNA